MLHGVKDFTGASDVLVLDTGLKKAPVGHSAGHKTSSFHFTEDLEGILELILLTICLDNYPIGHCAWNNRRRLAGSAPCWSCVTGVDVSFVWRIPVTSLEVASVHLIKELDCSREVTKADAHVNHAVEENFVGVLSELAWALEHLSKQVKGHLHLWSWKA